MKQHQHMGVHEVAERLGLSRQRVHELRRTYPDFPPPVATLKAGLVWHSADIDTWATAHPERPSGVRHRHPG